MTRPQRMILCGGLQSGGTTLLSWCFLQRADMDGVLDMPNDILQTRFDKAQAPIVWVKMTVGAFRWLDVAEVYGDLGWDPEPLLVLRDVRAALASLLGKQWGVNGTTGEEPPLRTRLRRFHHDWELFRTRGWPTVRFEDLVRNGRERLQSLCRELDLSWDEGMVDWPLGPDSIAYMSPGNQTFFDTIRCGSLDASLLPDKADPLLERLPLSELEWLEKTFAEYNEINGYDAHVISSKTRVADLPAPSFEGTAREWWIQENERLWEESERLRHGPRGSSP